MGGDRVGDLLAWGTEALGAAGIDRPRVETRLLLGHVTGLDMASLVTGRETGVAPQDVSEYRRLVTERAKTRVPIQYLLEAVEFRSLQLVVRRGVFIPRPETELVVEEGLSCLFDVRRPRVADVGAGTGAIGIAIARERHDVRVWAIEVDAAARQCIVENADRLGVGDRIRVVDADLLSAPVGGEPFDMIVCNPPYIRSGDIDVLAPEVREHEPRRALDGGPDGLCGYRALLSEAWRRLKPGRPVVMELGAGQAAAVVELAAQAGRYRCERIINDYAGHQRVLTLQVMEER